MIWRDLKFWGLVFMVILLLCAAFSPPVRAQSVAVLALNEEVVRPTVLISTGESIGTGTVIYSEREDTRFVTFVLTNAHVITGEGRRPRDLSILVRFFEYTDVSFLTGTRDVWASLVSIDLSRDLAVLRLVDSSFRAPAVARMVPPGGRLDMGEEVFSMGGPLGLNPFAGTIGHVGSLDQVIEGHSFVVSSAPAVPGNSGGGLWRMGPAGKWEMAAVISAINPQYNTISYSVPFWDVYDFLYRSQLGRVINYQRERSLR